MEVRFHDVRVARAGRDVLAVPGLTFSSGRVTAILGPNGSGKSTLLRTVAALERPRAGGVTIGGQPAHRNRRTREAVAFAFQSAIFVSGTLGANLHLALRLRGLPRPEREARIAEVTAACGITHLLPRDAHRLSGGEAQRANLARALALRAPITLLDEPLSGLDGPARRQLLFDLPGLLRDFAATTLLVTHERDEALRLAADLVVLLDGRVRAAGPKSEVLRRPPDAEVAAFLGYTLLPCDTGLLAIAPGAVRPGDSGVTFEMIVAAVVDMGTHREATGFIGEVPVAVPVTGAPPVPGAILALCADPASVVAYPAAPCPSSGSSVRGEWSELAPGA
ncbi:MAG: ATP-binding cassette domain-containing protein [Tepidiformaceae bacterium]